MSTEVKDKKAQGCYKTTGRTGKSYIRKRPAIQATVSESTLDMLKELSIESGEKQSTVIEKCIMFGASIFRKQFTDVVKVQPIVQQRKVEDMDNEERFMRSKIFDFKNNKNEWQSI